MSEPETESLWAWLDFVESKNDKALISAGETKFKAITNKISENKKS